MNVKTRSLLRYILPALGGLFVTYLYNVVDGIFVGRGVGSAALGAVNLAVPYITTVVALTALFPMGGATVAAIRMKNGKIFVSNRGHDGVTRLSYAHGRLTREAFMPTEGRCPRDILPLGDVECIAASQLSGGLEWIKGGRMIAFLPMNGAVCVIPAQ